MEFRTATLEDFMEADAPELISSSYKNVAYPLGCSISELEMALGDGEFVLLNGQNAVAGFVRIKSMVLDNCYIDLHLLNMDGSEFLLEKLIKMLRNDYAVRKFYVQLLPQESREISCLSKLGFHEEVRLRQHVFIDGRYHDLVMLGSSY